MGQSAWGMPPTLVSSTPPTWLCLQIDLPVEKGVVLLDIAFTGTDPKHGECTPQLAESDQHCCW